MADDIKATAEAAVEKIEDTFLAGIFPSPTVAAAVPPTNKPEETPPVASSAAEAVSESTEKPEAEESDPEWEKACTTLGLDGVPVAMLAKLDRAEVLTWASKAKERQAKTAQELKARTDRIKALESTAPTPKAETASPTAPVDDGELTKLKESFGDELAAPLAKLLEKRDREQAAKYEQRIDLLTSIARKQLGVAAKAGLREQFPQVDDPEKLPAFEAEMAFQINKFDVPGADPEEAYKAAALAAAKVLWHEEVQASNAGKALAKFRKRMDSQPTPPNGKAPTPKAMTPEEREDAILAAIFSGNAEDKERLLRPV